MDENLPVHKSLSEVSFVDSQKNCRSKYKCYVALTGYKCNKIENSYDPTLWPDEIIHERTWDGGYKIYMDRLKIFNPEYKVKIIPVTTFKIVYPETTNKYFLYKYDIPHSDPITMSSFRFDEKYCEGCGCAGLVFEVADVPVARCPPPNPGEEFRFFKEPEELELTNTFFNCKRIVMYTTKELLESPTLYMKTTFNIDYYGNNDELYGDRKQKVLFYGTKKDGFPRTTNLLTSSGVMMTDACDKYTVVDKGYIPKTVSFIIDKADTKMSAEDLLAKYIV